MTYEPWMGQLAGMVVGVVLIWISDKLDEHGICKFETCILTMLAISFFGLFMCFWRKS